VVPTIEKYSLKEIDALADRIAKRRSALLHSKVEAARKKVSALVKSLGLTMEDVFGTIPSKPATASPMTPPMPPLKKVAAPVPAKSHKAKLPPKYRDPKNPNLTWSAHGKRPEWIRRAQLAGVDLDTFLIKPNKKVQVMATGKPATKTVAPPAAKSNAKKKTVSKAPPKVTAKAPPKKVVVAPAALASKTLPAK
jgi:DNA-binding protein H-NS